MPNVQTLERLSLTNFRTELSSVYQRRIMLHVLRFVREHGGANQSFLHNRMSKQYEPHLLEDAVQALAQRGGVEGLTIIRRKGNSNYTIRPKNSKNVSSWEVLVKTENPELFMGA